MLRFNFTSAPMPARDVFGGTPKTAGETPRAPWTKLSATPEQGVSLQIRFAFKLRKRLQLCHAFTTFIQSPCVFESHGRQFRRFSILRAALVVGATVRSRAARKLWRRRDGAL
jgi:hypothetical protein